MINLNKSKSIDGKPIFIISLFLLSVLSSSTISLQAASATTEPQGEISADQAKEVTNALEQTFGMFREFGASGEAFATVFEMMFENFANMSATQEMAGTYVLNASYISDQESGSYEYGSGDSWEYTPWGVYDLENATETSDQDEYPYLLVNETGVINYNRTEGASVTFIIWDQDDSFINAIDKLLSTFQEFLRLDEQQRSGELEDDEALAQAISTLISAVSYFLIHINDIITGDEVIIFNAIGFTNYEADFNGTILAEWYITEDYEMTNNRTLDEAYPAWEENYRSIAHEYNDDYMLYMMDMQNNITEGKFEQRYQNYTTFSFDIIEIWLKEFQVSIDAEAIMGAITQNEEAFAGKTATDIFQELSIEFYIFTHHFSNFYLFDDTKYENHPDTTIAANAGNGVPDVLFEDVGVFEGETVQRISDTEVEDYILLRGATKWTFNEPTYEGGKMKWGIRADGVAFRVIPLGMKDDEVNETVAPTEHMDYLELGFSFEPSKRLDVNTGEYFNAQGEQTMGRAQVKLLQSFGAWDLDTDNKPFTPKLKDTEMDLAVVYMSAILHFKLLIQNKEIASGYEEPDQALLNESNYNSETHKVNVGDIDQELPLAEIDIAGPAYDQTPATGGTSVEHPAKTTTIPTVFAEWEGQNSETYVQEDNSTGRINSTVNVDLSLLMYAVSYDTFGQNGFTSGDEIVHDPTFSIFITREITVPWAVIIVVAGVGMVGIAAFMLNKKKMSKF
ncbi:hypothetical protein NEF87_002394 [Candidatus Lokiarchaeum ossiferum]|uniref:Uncharacterized protein n=1 Tax=Candidatus Lokiarchaeum ossiferum TaxID=2951803 RepID=A0ABY6HUI0_9ARCH|nr:hypothetical protein NEF87_002394 [Candidatus Lokiarchaeum sp. B-35]